MSYKITFCMKYFGHVINEIKIFKVYQSFLNQYSFLKHAVDYKSIIFITVWGFKDLNAALVLHHKYTSFHLKMETNNFSKLDHPDFMINHNKHKTGLCCQLFCPEYGEYDVSKTSAVPISTAWCHRSKMKTQLSYKPPWYYILCIWEENRVKQIMTYNTTFLKWPSMVKIYFISNAKKI
jgi:hypothetical protein